MTSAVVMVIVGVWLVLRLRDQRRSLGVALAAVGVGSVLFHGPGGPLAGWVHDVTVVMVPVTVALVALGGAKVIRRMTGIIVGTFIVTGVAAAALPATPMLIVVIVAATAAVTVAVREGLRIGWSQAILALAVLGVGGVVEALSGTGGPWCDPESLLQGHALWHLTVAVAIPLVAGALHPDISFR